MSNIITELKNLPKNEVNSGDFIIVTDVTSSVLNVQTKRIDIGEYTKYNITSSNIFNLFRSGSHTGKFIGNLRGTSTTSSISDSSSFSNQSNYLKYSLTNGTSSYSKNTSFTDSTQLSSISSTSSFALNTLTSSKTLHSIIDSYPIVDTSNYVNTSTTSSISQKSNYLDFNGNDNGLVYHSIISDTSSYSVVSDHLNPINTSKAYRAITSSYSDYSISASYSKSSSHSEFATNSTYSEKSEAHAYLSFYINGRIEDAIKSNPTKNLDEIIIVKSWYNINAISVGRGFNNCIEFIVQYENDLGNANDAIIKCSTSDTIVYPSIAYTNNADLSTYTPDYNLVTGLHQPTWVVTSTTSCSKNTFKITVVMRQFDAFKRENDTPIFGPILSLFNGDDAEMREVYPDDGIMNSYFNILVVDINSLIKDTNYPEQPPAVEDPKC